MKASATKTKTKIKTKTLTTTGVFIPFLVFAILAGIYTAPVHADTSVSGSSSANASITVANTINLTLTGGDLVIDNLTPGSASDSNIITATITSNSPYGYHLSATTGTSTGTTSLVNTADSNFVFTNLNANKASLSNFSDNTWGYSYSTDNGTSWISGDYGSALSGYNGLNLDNDDSGVTGITLYNNDSYAGSTAVKFKIGAKSAATQAAGTYTGTVNFYAVTNPKPILYMQDMTTAKLNQLLPNEHDTITLYDKRDEQPYIIAKLKDGNYWMTENLNLAGGSIIRTSDTNIADLSVMKSENGFLEGDDGVFNKLPLSAVAGFDDNYKAYVYNSGNTLANTPNCGKIGQAVSCYSYYSWAATTLGSGLDLISEGDDAPYSICPKAWRLPTSKNSFLPDWQTTSDYYLLARQYGLDNPYISESDSDFFMQAGPDTIPNFLLNGNCSFGSIAGLGQQGRYWSSTSDGDRMAAHMYFFEDSISSSTGNSWRSGFSVRCLFSGQ